MKTTDFGLQYIIFSLFFRSIFLLSACSKDALSIEGELDKELLTLSGVSEKNLYYWSDNRKIPLKINGYTITVRSKLAASELESQLSRLLKENLTGFTFYEGTSYMVISSKVHFGEFMQWKDVHPKHLFEQIIPSFFVESSPIIVTGELVLKPQKENTIMSILEEYGDQVELIKTTTYNTSIVKVNQLSSLLQIGNNIYESGMAEWCHPSFHSSPILFDQR